MKASRRRVPRKTLGGANARAARLYAVFALAGAAAGAIPGEAFASGHADECADAYEATQSDQHGGKLVQARTEARVCARVCPPRLAKDCEGWAAQVAAEIPSFVVRAQSADGAGLAVDVQIDGAPATVTETGAIEAEPGPHRLVLRHGASRADAEVDLVAGVRDRVVVVTFPDTPPARVATVARPTDSVATTRPAERVASASPVRWWLGGIGLAAMVSGGAVSVSGEVLYSQLRSRCAPTCTTAQADEVVERWIIGGSLMGVGGAMILAAIVWPAPSTGARGQSAVVSFGPRGISVAGAF